MVFILGVAATLIGLLLTWGILRLLGPWIMARASGVPLSMAEALGMRMRHTDVDMVVGTAIAFHKVGEPVSLLELEAAYMALPENRRTMTDLMRSVRPQVVANLEAKAKLRPAGSAA